MSDLYFAYGSNTDLPHLEAWCANNGYGNGLFRPIGVMELADVELAFNHYSTSRRGGTLNLRLLRGNLLQGLVLEVLSPQGWAALDRKEGVTAGAYRREQRQAIGPRGTAIAVTTYIASPKDECAYQPPATGYVDSVRAGYTAFGLDTGALDAAAAGQMVQPNIDAVFTYGTLLRGEERAGAVSAGAPSCILLAHAPGLLVDLGAFPAMLLDDAGRGEITRVDGEFVRFPTISDTLALLDGIEGAPLYGGTGGLYRRTVVMVGVGDGRIRPAWTYVMDDAQVLSRPVVASGCWRSRNGRRVASLLEIARAHHACQPDFFERLVGEARHPFQPAMEPGFSLTIEGVAQAMGTGELSERSVARASSNWAIQIR